MKRKTKAERERWNLELTAYHEAGHAVACVHFNAGFHRVSIVPEDDSLGHVLMAKFHKSFSPDVDDGPKVRAKIERHLLIGMAGMAAERRMAGRRNWRGGRRDLENASRLGSYLYAPKVLGPYIDFLIAMVDNLMESALIWVQVEAVAKALLEHTDLSSSKVRTLCREALQDQKRIDELWQEARAKDDAEQSAIKAEVEAMERGDPKPSRSPKVSPNPSLRASEG